MVGVEQWAELRREHFVAGKSIKRLVRETGLSKNTIRRALRSEAPPSYQRAPKAGILEAFKPEIHRLLADDPKLTGVRVRELLEPLGCAAGKTVVDDYLREVRPLFSPPRRTFGRGVWRPGEVCQFDVWQPRERDPGRARPDAAGVGGDRVPGLFAGGAGVLVFSKQTEDLLAGIAGCLTRLGALPETLLWDRQAGLHAHRGRPTDAFAAFCGQLEVGWGFCEPADPQAKGRSSALQDYHASELRAGPSVRERARLPGPARRLVCRRPTSGRTRRCASGPIDGSLEERPRMRPLPAAMPDVSRRWVTRVSPDPYLRVDSNDYSLDPALVGRRVEVRVDQQQIVAGVLDTGELACRHQRVFASTARSPRIRSRPSPARPAPAATRGSTVEVRPLGAL